MNAKRNEKIILTVGSVEQKYLAQKLISSPHMKNCRDVIVVSDADFSFRLGSGGAMLKILTRNYNSGDKIILINSGGYSKRSINYAVRGKAFAKFCYKKEEMFLLEAIITSARKITENVESGIFVLCGDILLNTDNLKIKNNSNTLFACLSDIETGTRHGVMFKNLDGKLQEFAHKESREALEKLSEKYNTESILIDTGAVFFNENTVQKILKAERENNILKSLQESKKELSLYNDIVPSLSFQKRSENIFDEILKEETADVLVSKGRFVHFGTLKDCVDNVISFADEEKVSINSSKINTKVFDKTLVENSVLTDCTVGENSIVTDVSLHGKVINESTSVCGFKLKNGKYVTVVTDINENPKELFDGKELWFLPRFFEGKSFDESFEKFSKNKCGNLSLDDIINNADFSFYFDNAQYISDMLSSSFFDLYDEMRDEIIDNFFSKNKRLTYAEIKKDFAEIMLPLRVNFSGTWTDAMPYCVQNGGEVINASVLLDGKMPIRVTAEKINSDEIELISDGVKTVFDFKEKESENMLSDFILHKAAILAVGIDEKTVLSSGFRLSASVEGIDKGSGLGTSSILLAGCMQSLSDLFGLDFSREDIVKRVFVAEQIMKTGGGWQDQVGAIFPSVKVIKSKPGIEQNVSVEEIALGEKIKNKFATSLYLVPTSQRHFGRFIVNDVAVRYLKKNPMSLYGFEKMHELNSRLKDAFTDDNFSEFCECLNEHFKILKMISPTVSNENIELITEKLKPLCDAVSICGAGGGGYLLAVVKDDITASDLKEKINENFPLIKSDIKKIDLYE